MLVLVADQDREVVEQARDILLADGFTVLGAADGDVAARLMNEQFPDLILLELQLPER